MNCWWYSVGFFLDDMSKPSPLFQCDSAHTVTIEVITKNIKTKIIKPYIKCRQINLHSDFCSNPSQLQSSLAEQGLSLKITLVLVFFSSQSHLH